MRRVLVAQESLDLAGTEGDRGGHRAKGEKAEVLIWVNKHSEMTTEASSL